MKNLTINHAGALAVLAPIVLQALDKAGVHLTADCVSQVWLAGVAAIGGITLYIRNNKLAGRTLVGGLPKE